MMKSMLIIQILMLMIMSMFNLLINSFPSHNKMIHPLLLSLILLMLTIMSSMNLSMYMNTHWFSFLMFLIMIGGMMIIFLYFTSFISNMKMSIKWNELMILPIKFLLMIMFIMMMLYNMMYNFPWYNIYNEINSMMNINNLNLLTSNIQINYMYTYNKNIPTIISMIYLLMCLTLIVKITINKKLTLRKIN